MGSETPGNVELNATMLLPAVAIAVDGVGAVDGRLGGTDLFVSWERFCWLALT